MTRLVRYIHGRASDCLACVQDAQAAHVLRPDAASEVVGMCFLPHASILLLAHAEGAMSRLQLQ
jgi:hypothetical protein